MSLRIAINTRLLLPGRLEGIGWFTYQTFKRIAIAHPEVEFHFIFDRNYDQQFVFADNIKPVALFPQARHPVLYYLFFEKALPAYLKKIDPVLFVSPDGLLSLSWKGCQIPVFHDLNFMHNPDYLPYLSSKYYRWRFPKFAQKAHRIATVSEYSKADIVKTFNYPAQQVDVVYNGVNEAFKPVSPEIAFETRKNFTGGNPYFVYVGSLHKRKNIDNMLLAFEAFKATDKQNHKMVIVGEHMFGTNGLQKVLDAMKHREDVIFTGRLYNDQLSRVVASASALLLVSYFEGFGIPIIEAMKCDVPVISSNVTSMPEVAGNAALLVNPHSVQEIAQSMEKVANDQPLRLKLIENGKLIRQQFSWDQTAERMWNCMTHCF
ncbi:MAG: glycosyltransferase family 4 protein [Bacteroidales bacterium]|nr:glycosyltransferase family 4 protein [Bacteroidales bacterium]